MKTVTLIVGDEKGLRSPINKHVSAAKHDEAFGLEIKARRGVLGLSQRALAHKIGITQAHLSRAETDAVPISPATRQLIVEALERLES